MRLEEDILQQLFSLMAQKGLTRSHICYRTGICQETLRRWQNGKTKRPQFATIKMAFRAIGYEFELVPAGEHLRLVA